MSYLQNCCLKYIYREHWGCRVGCQDGCERRIKVFVKIKKINLGGQGGGVGLVGSGWM